MENVERQTTESVNAEIEEEQVEETPVEAPVTVPVVVVDEVATAPDVEAEPEVRAERVDLEESKQDTPQPPTADVARVEDTPALPSLAPAVESRDVDTPADVSEPASRLDDVTSVPATPQERVTSQAPSRRGQLSPVKSVRAESEAEEKMASPVAPVEREEPKIENEKEKVDEDEEEEKKDEFSREPTRLERRMTSFSKPPSRATPGKVLANESRATTFQRQATELSRERTAASEYVVESVISTQPASRQLTQVSAALEPETSGLVSQADVELPLEKQPSELLSRTDPDDVMRDASRLSAQEGVERGADVTSRQSSKVMTSRQATLEPVATVESENRKSEKEKSLSREPTKLKESEREKTTTERSRGAASKASKSREQTRVSRKGASRGPSIVPQKSSVQGEASEVTSYSESTNARRLTHINEVLSGVLFSVCFSYSLRVRALTIDFLPRFSPIKSL